MWLHLFTKSNLNLSVNIIRFIFYSAIIQKVVYMNYIITITMIDIVRFTVLIKFVARFVIVLSWDMHHDQDNLFINWYIAY